jgi:hypothetical protein
MKTAFTNECGVADGCSVDRANELTDAALKERAAIRAGEGADRRPQGAIVASVDALRAITSPLDGTTPVVRIYDDPMEENPQHAIIRVHEGLPRPAFDAVRVKIIEAFSRRVA